MRACISPSFQLLLVPQCCPSDSNVFEKICVEAIALMRVHFCILPAPQWCPSDSNVFEKNCMDGSSGLLCGDVVFSELWQESALVGSRNRATFLALVKCWLCASEAT
jgi:hypothetical protein